MKKDGLYEKKEDFNSIKPASPFLQKYIAYYYFHNSEEGDHCSKFVYYPHTKNALSIYKNSIIVRSGDFHTKTIPHSQKYFFTYSKLTHQFAKAEIHAPFDKIGVVFQPLGLNHFIKEDLSNVLLGTFSLDFKYFEGSMTPFLDRIYASDCLLEKRRYLDEYFLSIYEGFQDERLERALELLNDQEVKYTVQSLAEELGLSRKTLLRIFHKHLCCSVKDYLSVVYFRRALGIYNNSSEKKLLIEVALDTDYYDQSEFISHFKKLTGFNPKRFFRKLIQYGKEETFWSTAQN
ncbi:MAG: helix-turn-helix domain-containing protein [Bacteroidia bacterium]|nr:helix-turn-helix domain-containing protein [Bacteroidia bacterium]